MNILSLFDGISCGQVALERVGIKVDNYYASEIDKYAIQVTQKNYPNTIQLGDITEVSSCDLPKIDLLIGGSPCQGFSFAGKQLNFDDPRSALFFEYVRLLEECKPKYFLLENVKMKKECQEVISKYLGVEPIEINSALVSAQNRKRLYWTNIEGVGQPEDEKLYLKDILETKGEYLKISKKGVYKKFQDKASSLTGGAHSGGNHSDMDLIYQTPIDKFMVDEKYNIGNRIGVTIKGKNALNKIRLSRRTPDQKARCLTAGGQSGTNAGATTIDIEGAILRRLTPLECERLQTLPDNYTEGVSNTQRYKALGNGWTVDVIAHIFNSISPCKA